MLTLRLLVLALAALAPSLQERGQERDPRSAPAQAQRPEPLVSCTPNSIRTSAGTTQVSNPVAAALKRAGPGTIIELAAGDYPAFAVGMSKSNDWNAAISGGNPGQPIIVRASGKVRIVPQSSGDTITIAQQVKCAHIRFEGLTIVCGYRAGVMFYKCGPGEMHEDFEFVDCEIDGGFDHLSGQGANSKWGVWGHSLKDFEFRGTTRPAEIRNIKNEHAFYLQNAKGDITIENVHAARIGRTFLQITARPGDGEVGIGTVTVRNCSVEDACIAWGDDYKGGSAFTVAGRHTGTLLFENNRYRAGFAPGIQRLTKEGQPYGTAAFVSWDGRGERNGTLILRNNDFEMAKGCGDRPLVSLGGCRDVQIAGKNRFAAGNGIALDINPPPDSGFASNPCGRVGFDPNTQVQGPIRVNGRPAKADQVAAMLAPQSETPAAPKGAGGGK